MFPPFLADKKKQKTKNKTKNNNNNKKPTWSAGAKKKSMRFFVWNKRWSHFPRKVTRYDVIQHGRPDVMTIQDGRPDAIQDGGLDVTSSKMADRIWRKRDKIVPGTRLPDCHPPPPIFTLLLSPKAKSVPEGKSSHYAHTCITHSCKFAQFIPVQIPIVPNRKYFLSKVVICPVLLDCADSYSTWWKIFSQQGCYLSSFAGLYRFL